MTHDETFKSQRFMYMVGGKECYTNDVLYADRNLTCLVYDNLTRQYITSEECKEIAKSNSRSA